MPKNFDYMELRPKGGGFCQLCGIEWRPKPDLKGALPDHKRFGLWEACGDQALNRGQQKKSVKICNDCLMLMRLASRDITTFHAQWLKIEMKEHPNNPRMSLIGRSVLAVIEEETAQPIKKMSWRFNDRGNILTPYCCFPLMTKVRVEIFQVFDAVTDEGEVIEGQVEIGLEMKFFAGGEEVGIQQHVFEFCPCCGKKIPKIFKGS